MGAACSSTVLNDQGGELTLEWGKKAVQKPESPVVAQTEVVVPVVKRSASISPRASIKPAVEGETVHVNFVRKGSGIGGSPGRSASPGTSPRSLRSASKIGL